MGGSHGGSTTLASMAAPENAWDLLAREKRAGFAAAVALYPGCGTSLGTGRADVTGPYRPVAPLLILIGEKDDWTPAAACAKLAASTRAAEHPVAITVYPGAGERQCAGRARGHHRRGRRRLSRQHPPRGRLLRSAPQAVRGRRR